MRVVMIGMVVCIVGLGVALVHQSNRIEVLESRLGIEVPSDPGPQETRAGEPERVERAALRAGGSDRRLARRLAGLESRLRWVEQGALERRGSGSVGEAPSEVEPEVEIRELRSNVDALLASEVMKSPEAVNRLREVIREEQTTARSKRWEQRSERRKEIENEELKQISIVADFSDQQLAEIQGLINAERDTIRVYYQEAHRGESSFSQARGQARQHREETDNQARELLDEGQFETYTKWRSEERRGHR